MVTETPSRNRGARWSERLGPTLTLCGVPFTFSLWYIGFLFYWVPVVGCVFVLAAAVFVFRGAVSSKPDRRSLASTSSLVLAVLGVLGVAAFGWLEVDRYLSRADVWAENSWYCVVFIVSGCAFALAAGLSISRWFRRTKST